jgi:hypothetical protein
MDPSHLPLSRIVYKGQKHMGILPRASLERKGSTDEEVSSNGRRDSNNSEKSRSGSSGFISTGFDIRSHKRQGPDGHETQDRRGSDESTGSSGSIKSAMKEPNPNW